jgi:hypothetical protein
VGAGSSSTTRRAIGAAMVAGLAVVLVFSFIGCGKPPQMGADEEVFNTVDALFTAITAHDEKLLGQCERRLQVCKETEKLSSEASDYLDGVIQKAHAGEWQPAAERLYAFMKAQRREGVQNHARKKEKSRPALERTRGGGRNER